MQTMIIDKPFDVVSAAVWQYLINLHDSYLRFEKCEEVPGAFVRFVAYGNCGTIELRKDDAQRTELTVTDPPLDSRDGKSAEELAEELVKYNQQDGLMKQYKTEAERQNLIALYQRDVVDNRSKMRARHAGAIKGLLSFLNDKISKQKAKRRPRPTDYMIQALPELARFRLREWTEKGSIPSIDYAAQQVGLQSTKQAKRYARRLFASWNTRTYKKEWRYDEESMEFLEI